MASPKESNSFVPPGTFLLLFLGLLALDSQAQRDCTGVECPLLEKCIEEVLQPGACCSTCVQRGCTCEGYQYYDCLHSGYRNGKVPAGASYLVDYGSTECKCPEEGGQIACQFIPCPELPKNCIEVAHPADRCPECTRVGCQSNGKKYAEGHSFLVEPCTICHCLESGALMCTPSSDCEGLRTGSKEAAPTLGGNKLKTTPATPTPTRQGGPAGNRRITRPHSTPPQPAKESNQLPKTEGRKVSSRAGGAGNVSQADPSSAVSGGAHRPGGASSRVRTPFTLKQSSDKQVTPSAQTDVFKRSLDTCCATGRRWASENTNCSHIPMRGRDTDACRSAREQCCLSSVEEQRCLSGILAATQEGSCKNQVQETCRGGTYKRCCECCTLGLKAQSLGLSCDEIPPLGLSCGQAFVTCCKGGGNLGSILPGSRREPRRPQEIPNTDMNECIQGSHNCGLDSDCHNTRGSFVCRPRPRCRVGFTREHQGKCIDINECVTLGDPCAQGYNCINTIGSFTCHRNIINCGRGYHASEDGSRCVDVDECQTGTHRCGERQLCKNAPGSYRCDCPRGYQAEAITRTCVDVNECLRYPGRICAQHCENVPGSYHCTCGFGYNLAADGRNCEDVNECESSPCSQECVNMYGSYQCYCRQGFVLSQVDRTTCEDVDECEINGVSLCSFRCVNTPGSFKCACPEQGYTLMVNGRNCKDVDECTLGIHNCSLAETCYNIQGGYRCLSFECPSNYRRAAENRCERISCSDYVECQMVPQRITYYQLTFPSNIRVPANIFRIGPSPIYAGDNVLLTITRGNEGNYFSTRRANNYSGYVYLQVPPHEPMDFLLDVEMTLIRRGTATKFVAKIYVFITGPSL
ncbi:fibulin-2-like [Latimeria chalumnae]|uniref:fibulin-2-like n=1 Tax=Latimeria chalumnae TaxID=7897 RepID=UPI00313BA57E